MRDTKLIERIPTPQGGFLFTMFPHQEPWVGGPPSKNLCQVLCPFLKNWAHIALKKKWAHVAMMCLSIYGTIRVFPFCTAVRGAVTTPTAQITDDLQRETNIAEYATFWVSHRFILTAVRGAAPTPIAFGLLMMLAHLGMCLSAVIALNLRPQCWHSTPVQSNKTYVVNKRICHTYITEVACGDVSSCCDCVEFVTTVLAQNPCSIKMLFRNTKICHVENICKSHVGMCLSAVFVLNSNTNTQHKYLRLQC